MFNERGHHFVRVTDVAYPLDLSDGRITGYANEQTIQVYGPLGYSSDLVATLTAGQHGAVEKARTMAAALSGCPVEEIEIDHRYWTRTGRAASTPTEHGVSFTPSCRVSRREHGILLNFNRDGRDDAVMAAVERAMGMPHKSTAEALAESQGDA